MPQRQTHSSQDRISHQTGNSSSCFFFPPSSSLVRINSGFLGRFGVAQQADRSLSSAHPQPRHSRVHSAAPPAPQVDLQQAGLSLPMETHGPLQLPGRSFYAFSMLSVLSPHTGQQSRATVQWGLAAALLGCPQGSAAWCSTLQAVHPRVVPHSTPRGKAGDVWRGPLVPSCYWGPAAPTLPVVHRADVVVGECHGIPGENESGVTAMNLGTAPGLPAGHCTLPSPGCPE